MKNCLKCVYAEWQRTKAGKFHPSGDGRCTVPYKVPPLPQSLYWLGPTTPMPCGGYINKKKELKDHCAYYEEYEVKP